MGKLTHSIIEYQLTQNIDTSTAFALVFPNWLEKEGFDLEKTTYDLLFEYAQQYGWLLYRASPTYLAEDKIRKKDGSILEDAYRYPSKELKNIYQNEDLDLSKEDIDNVFAQKYLLYQTLSLADCVARAYADCLNFVIPEWVLETVGVEVDLCQEEKLGKEYRYLKGYADWVFRVNQEEYPLAIFDFKTSKAIPTEEDVIWDVQLNFYALLYYTKFNEFPRYIGIYHLATGKIIAVEISSRVLNQLIEHYGILVDNILEGHFPKSFPTQFNSPCVRRNWKSKGVEEICPYLSSCWSDYYQEISDEELIKTLEEITK